MPSPSSSLTSPPPTKKIKTSQTSVTPSANATFLSPPAKVSSSLNNQNSITPSADTNCVTTNTNSSRCIDAVVTNIPIDKDTVVTCCGGGSGHDVDVRSLMLKHANYDIHNPANTKKRNNYMAWDDYFMALSFLSAKRSKDPEVQVGACIVDEENRIVGIGYNGFPRGCSDDYLPWASSYAHENDDDEHAMDELHTKHPFLCHAEINAILNKCSPDVMGTRMYVANIPDNVAAKTIIQAGIREIVYLRDAKGDNSTKASLIMFNMSGVKLRQYRPSMEVPPLDFCGCAPPENDDSTTTTTSDGTDVETEDSVQSTADNIADYSILLGKKHRELLMREAGFDPITASVRKRLDYLSWDDYFTSVAYLTARRSKDPNTQVGACIVDSNKCIVGIGYNGFPRGCSDDHLPWARKANSELHKKYPYVVHAEVNAILNKGSKDVKGASLYVALFPCNECAKVIIQSGIKEVVYLSDVVSEDCYFL